MRTPWPTVRLGEHCEKPQYGFTTSATRESKGGPRFLRITDLTDTGVDWFKVPYCDEHPNNISDYKLQSGDIVIARIGATTGKAHLVENCPDAIFASYLIRLRTKPSLTFLNAFLRTEDYWRQIDGNKGGRLKGGVNIPILASIQLPLPPLAEQREIVGVLRAVQAAIDTRRLELALERERKAAFMAQLFNLGTRAGGEWKRVRLGEIIQTASGGTPDRSNPSYWLDGTIPWVKTGEINYNTIESTEERISEAGLNKSSTRVFPKGTLLMAMFGQGATRGRVAILGIEAAINQACCALTPTAPLHTPFLFHLLSEKYEEIRALGHGANQTNLNAALIRSIEVELPSIEHQREVATTISGCSAIVDALDKEVTVLGELFHAILEKLIAGHSSVMPKDTLIGSVDKGVTHVETSRY